MIPGNYMLVCTRRPLRSDSVVHDCKMGFYAVPGFCQFKCFYHSTRLRSVVTMPYLSTLDRTEDCLRPCAISSVF